ncbi:MAG: 4Fe-4S dicluster domain-containing protein [Armatimonadetes bacterium]|nr:4Fe-4S dicluster domain-containing protein [Armatimonadota bacterium]
MEEQKINKQEALEKMRAELEGKRGQHYWRSLDEVSQSPEFKLWYEDEFPNRQDLLTIDRRTLLKFAGASLALAGLAGCRGVFLPEEKIIPYVKAPEELVPGKSLFYASAVTLAGYATGVLVEQVDGRPIKLEGNPDHPASRGTLGSISQAEVLNFYDPDRMQNVFQGDEISTWEEFAKVMRDQMDAHVATGGRGIVLLFGAVTSPTQADLIAKFQKKFPNAKVFSWEPSGRASVTKATSTLTGKPSVPVYDFSKAKVVVSLDGDFLCNTDNPGALIYARQFAEARKVRGSQGEMNRLYSIEANRGLVGAMSDHRYMVKPSELYHAALGLASQLGVSVPTGKAPEGLSKDLATIAEDLKANMGASIVVAGEHAAPEVHQAALLMNQALGNIGKTVTLVDSPEYSANYGTIADLVAELSTGLVDILYISNCNPVFTAPADLKFADKMAKAKLTVHLSGDYNETSKLSNWVLPMAHHLEAWGDARSFEGTATIIQPLIAPLFDGRSEVEALSGMMGESRGGYDIVRDYWKSQKLGGTDFEKGWRTAVHNGTIPNTASATVTVATTPSLPSPAPASSGYEAAFIPDTAIYDGRYCNNGWLQELPRPLTKVTWDNVVTLAPSDAAALGIQSDELVRITTATGQVEGIAYLLPGQTPGSVTLNLGYGREVGGTLALLRGDEGGGFNPYVIRTSASLAYAPITEIKGLGDDKHLASTQGHSPVGGNRITDDRDVIRAGTLEAFNKEGMEALIMGRETEQKEIDDANLFPEETFEYDGYQWGMAIDMNACTGCGACITACQAENNISVVGKEQVGRGREMHWIRTDRYYTGGDENPDVVWQPIGCMHCEKAPCEPVCPVAATVHSHEGLNQMVYNRCVGTRYCSNNCPYKVRRFNYLNWTDNQEQFTKKTSPWNTRIVPGPIREPKAEGVQLLKLLNNPDVTVRGRGVMEKCTYCVQRINEARIESKKAGTTIKDGDILTACQQTCPSQAIVFGNIADKDSEVAKLKKDPRSYLLLKELQTRPRTSHLAKLRNPNPSIKNENASEASK